MNIKSVFVISPHHYDHSLASIVEGLNKLSIKVYSNTNHNYIPQTLTTTSAQYKVAKMADVVLMCHSALESKYKEANEPIVSELANGGIDVFLDGNDYCQYVAEPNNFKLYIKRELQAAEQNRPDHVESLIFAAEDRYFVNSNKTHRDLWEGKTDDLACIMSSCKKRPWRFDIINSLKDAFSRDPSVFVGEYREGDTLKKFDTGDRHYSGYFQKLLNTKISVDSYGCGEARQTGRFWESLANGCMVMYQPIEPYLWRNKFVDDQDFIVYNDLDELVDKANYYISNSDQARKIAENGFNKMMMHHRTENRAKEFINLCGKYL